MEKLDKIFKFRDNESFKKFNKALTILLLACFVAVMVLVIYFGGSKDGKIKSAPYVFSLLPLILLVSFFRKNDYLFVLAEFVTIIADIFLILLKKIDIGFPIYLVVQLIYGTFFFFKDENKRRRLVIVIFRGVLMIISVVIMIILKKTSIKFIFGGMYFINIIINVIYSIIFKDPILIIGFSIFMISDSFIALGILAKEGSTLAKTLALFNFVYSTYLISQIVLMFNRVKNDYSKNKVNETLIENNNTNNNAI